VTEGVRHPVSLQLYRAESAERVRVEGNNGWGLFTQDGVWVEGPIRSADPTFCRWLASAHSLAERQRVDLR
jgi:hypothetical protein